MKKLLFLLITVPLISSAQKSSNGKVFDKHPAIDKVNQFTEAWITGDTETLKELTGEGFKLGSSMNNNPNYKGGDLNDLLSQSTWMSNNFVGISLKDRGQAYSDAIEYKKSGLFVQTFQEFIAWDKNNGFKLRTPFNAIFVFDKDADKIVRFWWSDNRAAWQKWNLSRQTIKNGTIYKDHPYISKVRQIWYNLERGNIEKVWKDFSPNALVNDSNSMDQNSKSLEDHQAYVGEVFSQFEFISIDEVGYPDYIDYEGNGGVVLAWYNMTLKSKKTKENIVLKFHSQHNFNEEGTIVTETLYYNGNLLK
ncbi:hypothetical protein N9H57_06135 [Flavobacteriaceae bacterium]|nr:hypothetical protein [Flavobacteriaceae bacterium]MDA7797516.1 hypothetical protein [Flavobacteriaceae bacterium]MDA8948699.1 hypothetical protein [Flavobacteriaceae bacterium]MDA9015993.1 hypothetical protein [Flavobacteriaceae bacterium]